MRFFMNDNERVVIREIKRLQQFEYSDADIKKHGKIIRKSKNSFYQKKFMVFKKRDDFSQVQVVNNNCSNEISQCKEKINCSLDSILEQKKKVRVKK